MRNEIINMMLFGLINDIQSLRIFKIMLQIKTDEYIERNFEHLKKRFIKKRKMVQYLQANLK